MDEGRDYHVVVKRDGKGGVYLDVRKLSAVQADNLKASGNNYAFRVAYLAALSAQSEHAVCLLPGWINGSDDGNFAIA